MKKITKIALGAVLMVCGSMLSAQTLTVDNPANVSSVVSEIPNTMDVNSYQDVEFNKLFGYLGYVDGFGAGASTYFGNIYAGLFFKGDVFAFDSTSSKTTAEYTNYKVTTKGLTGRTNSTNTMQLSTLIGLTGIGIKPSVVFKPGATVDNTSTSGSTKSTETDGDDYKAKVTKNKYSLRPQIDVGINPEVLGIGKIGGLALTPHAYFGMEFDPNVNNTEQEGKVNGQDVVVKNTNVDSTTWILFGLGSGIELPKKEDSIVKTSFDADLDFAFPIRKVESSTYSKVDGTEDPANTSSKSKAYGDSEVDLSIFWKTVVTPNEKIELTFKGNLPVSWTNSNDEVKTTTTTGSTTTDTYANTTTAKSVLTSIKPNVGFGMSYKPKTFVTLAAGAWMFLPSLDITGTTTLTYDTTASDRKLVSKRNSTTTELSRSVAGDFNLDFYTGFRIDISDSVIFDCSYDILGDLFGNNLNMSTLTNQSFWDGVGKICFHTLYLQVAFKL